MYTRNNKNPVYCDVPLEKGVVYLSHTSVKPLRLPSESKLDKLEY